MYLYNKEYLCTLITRDNKTNILREEEWIIMKKTLLFAILGMLLVGCNHGNVDSSSVENSSSPSIENSSSTNSESSSDSSLNSSFVDSDSTTLDSSITDTDVVLPPVSM